MKAVDVVCPDCGQPTVFMTMRMVAKPIGDFSLAGEQVKFSMSELPVLFCSATMAKLPWEGCEWELTGRMEGEHAVFTPSTSPEESSLNG